jgi:two-component system sensor kinase
MGQLIDDLLALSRIGRQELSEATIDMTTLAESVADEIRRHEPDRDLRIRIDALPPARGERTLVRQVFTNLLGNAAKFTRPRGSSQIEVGSYRENEKTVYYVRDDGVGFDMKYADKMFGVFQRLHRPDEFEGTGVGLAIVHRIVTRHDGRVWAHGEPGQGATFFFTLS